MDDPNDNGHEPRGEGFVLPADPSQIETVIEAQLDERLQRLAGVKLEDRRYLESDLAQLAELEAATVAQMLQVHQEVLPQYRPARLQALGDAAIEHLVPYETNRIARLERALRTLQDQAPRPQPLSEIAQNTRLQRTIFILQQLTSDLLNDPLLLRARYLEAVDQGEVEVVMAIEDDPLRRYRRALRPEDLERGKALQGLAAAPELRAQIEGYTALIARYRSRIAALKRRLAAQGWAPADPIRQQALGDTDR